MRILAIETASEACSVALFEREPGQDFEVLGHDYRVLGRGHAEQLVPMIAALPERGKADRILVSLGPGSFTGVRIGIAAARALGVAWSAEVRGYPTLRLLADMNGAVSEDGILVCVNGGHGEWFVQPFAGSGEPIEPMRSLPPAEAVKAFTQTTIIGSKAEDFVALRGSGRATTLLPDALAAARLPDTAFATSLSPIYGRQPDAKRAT